MARGSAQLSVVRDQETDANVAPLSLLFDEKNNRWIVEDINTGNKFVYSVLDFTYRMTEPFLNRIRAFLPNLGAFDISPVILLMLIWIMQMCMEYYIRPVL